MKTTAIKVALALLVVSGFYSSAEAKSPPANTIPIISMKTGQDATCEDITIDVLCMLLWNNFDGIWVEGKFTDEAYVQEPAEFCDSTRSIMILAPGLLQGLNNWPTTRWGRYTAASIALDSAFIHPNPNDFKLISNISEADSILGLIEDRAGDLYTQANGYDCIWYYDIFNEAPARQLSAMLNDSSAYDDYFPSLFTQDTMMTEVLPSGIFSWEKWKSDALYSSTGPTVSVCTSMLHTIDSLEWAGIDPGVHLGDEDTQANSINAYFDMEYLDYSGLPPYETEANTPDRIDLNTYPIRMAGYYWQTITTDSITVLGSATDLWMLEHYELYMDSTFIPAGDHDDGPFPVYYHPQALGRTGGRAIWHIDTIPPAIRDTLIQYRAYEYRIPSPAEFKMLCNIGLLRGAKGVFPYSLRSYTAGYGIPDYPWLHDTGLLDENLIPFDAPYEEWVYRDRPTSDFYYAPPDSIPPWTAADGSQFDPLYSLPSEPSPPSPAKADETYLEWKFAPYGRLWNSISWTFKQIAWVAPELAGLWWWYSGDRFDNASIEYDGTEPQYFADPHIRVFTDSTETDCYLFYVNRFCRANDNPFEITIDSGDFFPTSIDISEYALDHSRRFLIEGSQSGTEYTFLDTLDAGEARLLQMFDDTEGLDPDIRITDPDVFAVRATDGDTLTDFTGYDGAGVNIRATFYNMGTDTLNNVRVYLENLTTDEMLDTVTVSFNALTTDTCWQVSRDVAEFDTWTPDATELGVNVFSVYTEDITGEPDPTDNSATLVYLVKPLDYATEVLDDSWDMSEPAPPISPPAWKTFDIDSLEGSWGSYTDSISGMFEGVLSRPDTSNALYLNVGSGSSDYIDADKYQFFSLAGRSNTTLNIIVHWIDERDNHYYIDTGEDFVATASDIGPVDLYSLSLYWGGDLKKMWLEFSGSNVSSNVRIGWVKLTE